MKKDRNKKGKGWREKATKEIVTRKGRRKKVAPMHHEAQVRKKIMKEASRAMNTPMKMPPPDVEIKPSEDKIKQLEPAKTAAQSVCYSIGSPQAAVMIEIAYQFFSNFSKIRSLYNFSVSTSNKLIDAYEALKAATKNIVNSKAIQPIKEEKISEIVETISNDLEEKQEFTRLIKEELKLDESSSSNFKDFYKTSLKNILIKKFDDQFKSLGEP